MYLPMMPFFGSEVSTATLTTYAAGSEDAAGKWVPGAETPSMINIYGGLQPLTKNELQQLSEGERIKSYVKTYTDFDVDTRVGQNDADKLTAQGHTYKVTQVEKRPIGNFSKIIMRRIDE